MLLVAVLVASLYEKLIVRFRLDRVFLFFTLVFASFIAAYAFLFYPNREFLAWDGLARTLFLWSGDSHAHIINLGKYWFDVLFFIIAELWGSFLIVTLVWGVANALTTYEQSGRFYSLITAGSHVGTIIGGYLAAHIPTQITNYGESMKYLLSAAVVACFGLLMMIGILNRSGAFAAVDPQRVKRKKRKASFVASFKAILSSRYLASIALIVVGYGFTMNLVELVWKDAVKDLYSASSSYQMLMGNITAYLGTASLLFALFISGNAIRGLGWYRSAMATPILICFFVAMFFVCYFAGDLEFLKTVPLDFVYLAVIFGSLHNIAAKLLKYNLFDPTKEMAYIPLPFESKTQAKAAIDTVSSRLGKSGSSWLLIVIMEMSGASSIAAISGALLPFIAVGFVAWVVAIHYIGKNLETTA